MEFTKQRGYNGKKAKVTYFFFGPTPLHDHAASRLVKSSQKFAYVNSKSGLLFLGVHCSVHLHFYIYRERSYLSSEVDFSCEDITMLS